MLPKMGSDPQNKNLTPKRVLTQVQHQNFKIEVQSFKVELFYIKVELEAEVKVEVRNCNPAVLTSRWKYATATEPPRRTCIRAELQS